MQLNLIYMAFKMFDNILWNSNKKNVQNYKLIWKTLIYTVMLHRFKLLHRTGLSWRGFVALHCFLASLSHWNKCLIEMDFAVIKAWGLRSRIIQIRLASHQPAFELLIALHGIEDYIYHIGISKQAPFFFKLFRLRFWLHWSSKKWLVEKMRCLLYNWPLWCTNSLLCLLFDSCIIIFPFSFRPLRTSMAPTSASSHLPLQSLPHFTQDRIWDSSLRYSIMWKKRV